jgi:hypothetical protein
MPFHSTAAPATLTKTSSPLQSTPTTSPSDPTETTPATDTNTASNVQSSLSTPAIVAIATLSGLLFLALLALSAYYIVRRRRKLRNGREHQGLADGSEIPWSAVETYTPTTATLEPYQQSPGVGGVGAGGDMMHVKVEGDQEQQQQEGRAGVGYGRAELPGREAVVEMSADGRYLR